MILLDEPILFLATADPQRSRRFYEQTLGLVFVEDEPYAMVFRVGHSLLRIQKVQAVKAPPYTALGWLVSDIRATVGRLCEAGVKFERYEGMQQDADGI